MTNISLYMNDHIQYVVFGMFFITLFIFSRMVLGAFCNEEKRNQNEDDLLLKELEVSHRANVYGAN